MERAFQNARKKIDSDKVRERQEGLKSLQELIQRDNFITSISEAGSRRGWLPLFQALFDAFDKEHKACIKAGKDHPIDSFSANNTAVRRLCDVASTMRKVIERGGQLINEKVLHSLIAHLTRHCAYRGHLLPVALDYAKSLKYLLSWKPHIEQISPEDWCSVG